MFSLVYVILPFSDTPPGDAISKSLARYQRGTYGDVPDGWIAFHDETALVQALHETSYTFTRDERITTKGGDTWDLNFAAISAELDRRGASTWKVRFADYEPKLERFVARFLLHFHRHPVTGGFGKWLNPLGHWDWWDLGGRFNGAIGGDRRPIRPGHVPVSSGPSRGRDLVGSIQEAVAEAIGSDLPAEVDVRSDDNVELVETLLTDLQAGKPNGVPGAILLPPGSAPDVARWVGTWPEIGPAAALAELDCSSSDEWPHIVRRAYERFPDHWAAGVAYHF